MNAFTLNRAVLKTFAHMSGFAVKHKAPSFALKPLFKLMGGRIQWEREWLGDNYPMASYVAMQIVNSYVNKAD